MARSARCSECASACVPIAQTCGVSTSPSPATAPIQRERVSTRTRSTVTPAATATQIAENRFMRKAGSPNGWRRTDASQPRST